MNIGTDHENTTFFDYLGVTLKDGGGDYEVVTLKGNCAECTDLLKYYYLGGVSPHYKVDRLQDNGGTNLMSSEEGQGRMFVYENEDYKAITSSVVMGAIANSDSLSTKPYLLSEFVNYFIGYNPVTALAENVEQLIRGEVFPNPVADHTTIAFKLDEAENVSVTICDINGSIIKHLAAGIYGPGNHSITWEATNDAGAKVENGLYFCTIKSGNLTSTTKLVVLP